MLGFKSDRRWGKGFGVEVHDFGIFGGLNTLFVFPSQLFGWHYFMLFLWMFLAPLLIIPLIFMGIFFGVCQVKVVKQLGKTCIKFDEYGKSSKSAFLKQKEIVRFFFFFFFWFFRLSRFFNYEESYSGRTPKATSNSVFLRSAI